MDVVHRPVAAHQPCAAARHAAPGRTDSSDRVGVAAYAASKQAFNSSADDVALLVTAMFRPLVVQTKLRRDVS